LTSGWHSVLPPSTASIYINADGLEARCAHTGVPSHAAWRWRRGGGEGAATWSDGGVVAGRPCDALCGACAASHGTAHAGSAPPGEASGRAGGPPVRGVGLQSGGGTAAAVPCTVRHQRVAASWSAATGARRVQSAVLHPCAGDRVGGRHSPHRQRRRALPCHLPCHLPWIRDFVR